MALHPSQIVCLRHENIALYAEVIQLAIARPLCWVRPLALVEASIEQPSASFSLAPNEIYSLKEGSDLLWPTVLFQPAVDVDVIPLLTILESKAQAQDYNALASAKLQQFIQRVWEAHAPLFEETNSTQLES